MRTVEDVATLSEEIDRVLGWQTVRVAHLNDSKVPFASRKDRHEHIGLGEIGEEGFRAFLSLPRIREIPGIIETPSGEGMDRINLAKLRQLS